MKHVDYVIIGAGMAGTVLRRFLDNQNTVLLDPKPGRYKIGESIIPEHFHHPVMAAMLPRIRQLPSYSPKVGTLFMSKDSVASFPLPPNGLDRSAHVAREELEPLMHEVWETPIVREKVEDVDLDNHLVRTDKETYHFRHQVIDCSGPSMVIARQHDLVRQMWPTHCRWAYFDITSIDNERFGKAMEATGKRYVRFDAPNRVLLPGREDPTWKASQTTTLTELEKGLWNWQIPLFNESLLSFGLVSRAGPVDDELLFATARDRCAPQYTLRPRPQDRSSSWNRVHVRNGFARAANTAATMDYILMGDAFAFADPIYSVGTGLAVNKAIELAGVLNAGSWTETSCEQYNADYARIMQRAVEGFDHWYSGELMTDDEKASSVQRNLLSGSAFQVGIAMSYATSLLDASPRASTDGLIATGRYGVDADGTPIIDTVSQLLGLEDGATLAGWTLNSASATSAGPQIRLGLGGKPELTVMVLFSPRVTQYYRRVGDISLSFINLFDGPYPFDENVKALFDVLEDNVRRHEKDWLAFWAGIERPTVG